MSLLNVKFGNKVYLAKYESPKPTVTIGGRKYPIVQIGRQWWIAENLDYKWNGLSIDIGTSRTDPIAYYIGDDPNNEGLGLLYNWAAAYNLNVNRNSLLPEGWRVSNDNDLLRLQQSVGGEDLAGYHLKSKDWPPSDDSVGFNAIKAGIMNEYGVFIGNASNFWSSDDAMYPKLLEINGSNDTGSIFGYHKPAAFCIRVCKDATVNIGGRDYPTTRIGNQVWLAENLDLKWDGLKVGESGTSSEEPRANYYNNDESTYGVNGNKYGLLYNWQAAKYLEDRKNELLPKGWRVATASDWDTLATTVGASVAGTKLKSTTGWSSGNGDGTYKFEAFPAGSQNSGSFYSLGTGAYFWTATESSSSNAYWNGFNSYETMYSNNINKSVGCSVRLVKDAT